MEFDVDSWREELRSYRDRKDEQFAGGRGSPLPPDERAAFDGLDYFEPDPDYRVAATVEVLDGEETVTMETSTEGERLYDRAARLRFEVPDAGGEPVAETLVAYRRVDVDGDSLFVPFRDKTTGQGTYPGGRYMELHVESASRSDANSSSGERSDPREGELEDREVPLDFNLAYSPFCAYSEAYKCPLPPRENWLEVAIPAGERYK
ncbi:hypothetical protein BRD02_07115 [Halobacteriales archaeon QS_8_69_73]|nr:MAG: hypothetical protein BRD02_07115 [Halobacteriales archaeon QS_8_69_73]